MFSTEQLWYNAALLLVADEAVYKDALGFLVTRHAELLSVILVDNTRLVAVINLTLQYVTMLRRKE